MTKPANLVTSIQVEINAPASVVWEVLTDFDKYPEWNSFCFSIRSSRQIDTLVEMMVRNPHNGVEFPVNEYLVAYEPERLLSWEQRAVPENKDAARRDQYIEAIDANRCTYFNTDQFLGVNAETIMREHGAWVKTAFDNVARDVKKRAEALHAAR
ncbi:MAG: SRPBCC domain-containing protein [Comamonas sp.]